MAAVALALLGLVLLLAWAWLRERRRAQALRAELDAVRGDERTRLMRELHDGVGAQLVGMLQLVERPQWPRGLIAEQLAHAVDDLRMAIDSLQPEAGDVAALLAQLRHRLLPRLEAAGLRVHWPVVDLPPLHLDPAGALQLQRLLVEASTNVLKHAKARELRVEAGSADDALILRLCDDGVGLGVSTDGGSGQGLASMQARALRLGATLELQPVLPQGLCVCLRLPL